MLIRDSPDAAAARFSAERGVVELDTGAGEALVPGRKATLAPWELASCVNQYDYIRAVRGGKLEGYWHLSARGKFA